VVADFCAVLDPEVEGCAAEQVVVALRLYYDRFTVLSNGMRGAAPETAYGCTEG
jgi:hypothetical protein